MLIFYIPHQEAYILIVARKQSSWHQQENGTGKTCCFSQILVNLLLNLEFNILFQFALWIIQNKILPLHLYTNKVYLEKNLKQNKSRTRRQRKDQQMALRITCRCSDNSLEVVH